MIIVFIVSLFSMAIFSAAETSYVAADKVSLVVLSSRLRFKSAFFFLKDNRLFFATIVVGSNLFIAIFSSLADMLFHERMGLGMSVVLPLTTIMGFFFGELIPKSIALENSESSAKYLLPIVKLFYLMAEPLVRFTSNVSTYIARSVFHSSLQSTIFQRRDVYRFLGNTASSGFLDKIESEIIRKLLTNANLPVKNFSVPRTQIVAVKLGTGIDKLREIFEKTGKTKVLVFDSSLDNIVGVVHAKDIFMEVEKPDQLISDVLFVPENMTVIDLLEEFRTERVYVAILIDEFGGTSGLVTSSDIMEVFLGDVVPLAEQTRGKLRRINGRQFIIHGSVEVAELETNLRIKLPKGDFTTVAGLLISMVGKIPAEGEKIYVDSYEFQILKSDGRKLESLKLTV
ncbi:MAG: hemolysin family protein [Candidatus Kryptoniota bacterium]